MNITSKYSRSLLAYSPSPYIFAMDIEGVMCTHIHQAVFLVDLYMLHRRSEFLDLSTGRKDRP